jgi:hypothetical protein
MMQTPKSRSAILRTAAVAALAAALAVPSFAVAAQRYKGGLVNDDPREGRKIENLSIAVDRLSTPEELAALANGGAAKAPEVGSARLDRTTARAAVAAVEVANGSGKKLVLVFDKPLNWFDARRAPSAKKYPYSVVEIELDGNGGGKGRVLAGAQVTFSSSGVEIGEAAGEPMRLVNVSAEG